MHADALAERPTPSDQPNRVLSLMPQTDEKLDCFVRVITPENIEFEYALAGPFQRLPAFLFDFAVRALVFFGLIILTAFAASWVPAGQVLVTILALLLFFALSWFYGIFFETRFNGRTLGKMIFKLRVISVDGRPINGVQAALRNLLRLADMSLMISLQVFTPDAPPAYIIPTMLVGLVCMTLTRRMQRVGDLAAGTMVISESQSRSPWNLQPEDLRAFGLAELIPPTFQVSNSLARTIGLYMENRKRLSVARRSEVSKHLASLLIREFNLLPDTSPDLLLCALYVRVYLSEEQRTQGREQMRRTTSQRAATPPPVHSRLQGASPQSASSPKSTPGPRTPELPESSPPPQPDMAPVQSTKVAEPRSEIPTSTSPTSAVQEKRTDPTQS